MVFAVTFIANQGFIYIAAILGASDHEHALTADCTLLNGFDR